MASLSVGLLLTPGLVLDLNSNITGYYRELPGFGRYAVLGSDKSGVFNLQINNASLSDEAVYECQVGPNGTNKPIRASAKLNVLREYLRPAQSCLRAGSNTCHCSAAHQGRAGRPQDWLRAGGEGGGGGGAQLHHPQRQAQARHHLVSRGPGVCTR